MMINVDCLGGTTTLSGILSGPSSLFSSANPPIFTPTTRSSCLPEIRLPDDWVKSNSWAADEFVNAKLGDKRRVNRLIQLAEQRSSSPNASIPQGCGSAASTKAAYRFYDNQAISADDILASHRETTCQRMSKESVVLAVQDTTGLYSPPIHQRFGNA